MFDATCDNAAKTNNLRVNRLRHNYQSIMQFALDKINPTLLADGLLAPDQQRRLSVINLIGERFGNGQRDAIAFVNRLAHDINYQTVWSALRSRFRDDSKEIRVAAIQLAVGVVGAKWFVHETVVNAMLKMVKRRLFDTKPIVRSAALTAITIASTRNLHVIMKQKKLLIEFARRCGDSDAAVRETALDSVGEVFARVMRELRSDIAFSNMVRSLSLNRDIVSLSAAVLWRYTEHADERDRSLIEQSFVRHLIGSGDDRADNLIMIATTADNHTFNAAANVLYNQSRMRQLVATIIKLTARYARDVDNNQLKQMLEKTISQLAHKQFEHFHNAFDRLATILVTEWSEHEELLLKLQIVLEDERHTDNAIEIVSKFVGGGRSVDTSSNEDDEASKVDLDLREALMIRCGVLVIELPVLKNVIEQLSGCTDEFMISRVARFLAVIHKCCPKFFKRRAIVSLLEALPQSTLECLQHNLRKLN